jgi:MYXO-CTERM domain-containing protein
MGSVISVVPDAPKGLTAKSGNDQVMLSWTAPVNDGGDAIDYYVIYQNGVAVKNVNSTSTNITGLTNGQNYTFQVAAHNSVGIGNKTPITTIAPSSSSSTATGTNDITSILPFIIAIAALLVVMVLAGLFLMRRRRDKNDQLHKIPQSTRVQYKQSGQKLTSTRQISPKTMNDKVHPSKPVTEHCLNCGSPLTDGDFCGNCGNKVR